VEALIKRASKRISSNRTAKKGRAALSIDKITNKQSNLAKIAVAITKIIQGN
jgi:hypothetical protein